MHPIAEMVSAGAGEHDHGFLRGGGEMGALMRAHDWAATPLGSPAQWPQSLKTAVRIMLTSRQPIWIGWGPDLVYLYNDPYKTIIGGRHPWALGQPASVVWREIWKQIGPMLATAMGGIEGTYVEEQLLIMERNGYPEETYYTFSYSPIPDDDGSPGGIICANTDDTQRVIGERQLSLLRELAAGTSDARNLFDVCTRSAAALQTNPQDLPFALLYISDQSGEFSLVATSGVPPNTSASLGVSDFWPLTEALRAHEISVVPDLASRFGDDLPSGAWPKPPTTAAVLPILSAGETGRAGALVVGLNPFRQFDMGYRGFLSLAAGQISGAIANAEAYEAERRRAEALAEIDRAKTLFFSNVSHEFRTPLTLMMGPVEEILAKPLGDVAPDTRALIEVVHRNAQRLLKLVNALLDFSRIEAGRIQVSYERIDLAALTIDLANNFRLICERAGLQLRVDCPPLPHPVYVDREMWEKIVLNLLSNSFKFTFEGEIAVSLHATERAFVLKVSDTGTGIPKHELPRLFVRFHRVEGAKGRSYEGSGIGLALVQELVSLNGGDIQVESEEGRGTIFTVSIPRENTQLTADRIRAAQPNSPTALRAYAFVEEALRWLPQTDAAPPMEKEFPGSWNVVNSEHAAAAPRVVVADDNADMRDYLGHLLAAAGHDVETVVDGHQALIAIRLRKPDLLITDVMMPGMGGFELVKAVRADEVARDLPVIILSARVGEEARIDGLVSGADDYLVKPFAAREFLARVRATLKVARVRREAEAALREEARTLETLNKTGAALASELDLERVVQMVTDAGVELTNAQFGAFFYNVLNEAGESYMLYTLSGVERSHFENFPMPRNTAVFAPTFSGEDIVRSDDILTDPRYGKNQPNHGMPEGHLPVRSYLAVPVKSRSGEVIGGLFFGHPATGRFDERHERLMVAIAAQAAVAIDNARLYQAAQREIKERRQAEESRQLLLRELNHRVKNLFAVVAGMITMTARTTQSPGDMAKALSGRLMALSRAHELIRPAISPDAGPAKSVNLRDVLTAVVEPHLTAVEKQISIEGEDLEIGPTTATSFALVLHELATNAAKYGALSVEGGRLSIKWLTTEDMLILSWEEHDGPSVKHPSGRTGFGTRLAQMSAGGQLGGDISFDWRPEGIRITLRAAIERLRH